MLLQRAIDIASLNPKPLSINFYIKVKIHWTCRWGDNPRHKFENFWWCTVTPLYLNSETKRLTWKRTLNRLGYKIRKHKFLLHTQILLPASNFPTNVDEFKELNVSPADFYCSRPIGKVLNPKPWAHSDGKSVRQGTCNKESPGLWSWTPTDTFVREAPQCQCGDIQPPSLEAEAVPESGYGMRMVWGLSNCCGYSTQHCSLLHCTHKSPHHIQLPSISNEMRLW